MHDDQYVAERGNQEIFYGTDKRIVTLGGGTGPFAFLSSLKRYQCAITAIVTMADSGGSSRRLMDEFGQLPFGDLRQALVALSRKGSLWRDVFGFRFPSGYSHTPTPVGRKVYPGDQLASASMGLETETYLQPAQAFRQREVSGHNLGNLILSALENMNGGNLLWALEDAQELLDTAGRVLPVTLEHATLCVRLDNGDVLQGESAIDLRGQDNPDDLPPIEQAFLLEDVAACEQALRAIQRADVIVIGPGDLYTSILPNLLVHGVPEAVRASRAEKVYICNLMTKHGETDGFRASDFVRELQRYLGGPLDRVIMHDGSFPSHLQDLYAAKQQYPVEADLEDVRRLVPEVVVDSFLTLQGDTLVRHNAERLIQAVFASPIPGIGTTAVAPVGDWIEVQP